MGFRFFLAIFTLGLSFLAKLHEKSVEKRRKEEHKRWWSFVREHYQKIRIEASRCDVLEGNEYEKIEDKNGEELVLKDRTFLRCYHQEVIYRKTIDIHYSIAQTKINAQGYVDVYIYPEEDYYIIDLEFLDKPLEELLQQDKNYRF
ncbi:hypothetical protein [Capnocytophaga cynodegmi]|uniref:hypothetical protein n=1 Tax=Capnocytophaga cynodegmi TaxID=28189 RepID=UPI00385D4A16